MLSIYDVQFIEGVTSLVEGVDVYVECDEDYKYLYKDLEEEYNRVIEHFGRGGNPALEKLLIDTKMKVSMEATAKGIPYK